MNKTPDSTIDFVDNVSITGAQGTPTPAPATLALCAMGLAGLAVKTNPGNQLDKARNPVEIKSLIENLVFSVPLTGILSVSRPGAFDFLSRVGRRFSHSSTDSVLSCPKTDVYWPKS